MTRDRCHRHTDCTSQAAYARRGDLIGSVEGARGIGGMLARSHGYSSGTGNWSTHNFYHADGNGNITYLVNSSQTVAATYRDPYGNTISSSGTLANANVYRFSSKEVHTGSGLYYYGFRFYEPNFQRWLNRDPKWEEGFAELSKISRRGNTTVIDRSRRLGTQRNFEDLYVFVFNNPLNRNDPLGLDTPGCSFPVLPNSPAVLECCAIHDECFALNECTSRSWWTCAFRWSWSCAGCNAAVTGCLIDAPNTPDDPDRPNFYCGQCRVYFDVPRDDLTDPENNPHYGHSTNRRR